jgi:hypothetical protein
MLLKKHDLCVFWVFFLDLLSVKQPTVYRLQKMSNPNLIGVLTNDDEFHLSFWHCGTTSIRFIGITVVHSI